MSFATEFSSQRKKINVSQEKVSKKVGVSRTYITLIKNGKRLPGKKHLSKIADALQVKKRLVVNWYLEDLHDKLI